MHSNEIAVFALAGLFACACAGNPSSSEPSREVLPPARSADEALSRVDENLERLRTLGVFEVGEMIIPAADETGACVGGTCRGREGMNSEAVAALRLDEFRSVAESSRNPAYAASDCIDRVQQNLGALRALEIVQVFDFAGSPAYTNCYHTPCGGVYDAETLADAADLESIAHAASSL